MTLFSNCREMANKLKEAQEKNVIERIPLMKREMEKS